MEEKNRLYTIGKLALKFNLSRTALLYYDKIDLLKPISRTSSGYRLYDHTCVTRLENILLLRRAGVALEEIKTIIDAMDQVDVIGTLMKQIDEINQQVEALQEKQAMVLRIIEQVKGETEVKELEPNSIKRLLNFITNTPVKTKEDWHLAFERQNPKLHHQFLALLGLNETEIDTFRQQCQKIRNEGSNRQELEIPRRCYPAKWPVKPKKE